MLGGDNKLSTSLPPIKNWDKLRRRIEHEDGLLNARVNIFLVLNGLGAASFGLSKSYAAQIVIAVVVLTVNLLLWLCTLQTALVIRNLTTEYIHDADDPIDKCVRHSLKWLPRRLRSTFILGVWLPLVLFLGWIIGLIMLIIAACEW